MALSDLTEKFLVAAFDNISRSDDDKFEPFQISTAHKLGFTRAQLRILVRKLEAQGFIEYAGDYDPIREERREEENDEYRLTVPGFERADEIGSAKSSSGVPASDRYVSIDHNQKAEVEAALVNLREEVRGDNEVVEEDRLIALSEIAAFEATIIQPRVSTVLVERFISAVLTWMTRTFSKAAIADVAQKLIQALAKLLSPGGTGWV